jgi:hypothetical protein
MSLFSVYVALNTWLLLYINVAAALLPMNIQD